LCNGYRAYRKDTRGLKTNDRHYGSRVLRRSARKITLPKKNDAEAKIEELKGKYDEIEDVRVLIQPNQDHKCPQKKPEIIECGWRKIS